MNLAKPVSAIHRSSDTHWVGDGFPVRSVFSYTDLGKETLSPFLLMDYAAPHVFPPAPRPRGVGAHPHKGFETVTIVYRGELEHRDSSGGGGKIGPGDVQWMTAGSGIVHEEFHSHDFTRAGGELEMVQLWVNLRARDKSQPPRYQTLLAASIPAVEFTGGGSLRVIAGAYNGSQGPARTFSPVNLWDVRMPGGAAIDLALTAGHVVSLFILRGAVTVQDRNAQSSELVILARDGSNVTLNASTDAHLILLSGEPLNEPVVGYGPFVMNTEEEIRRAFQEYREGRMGTL